MKLTIKKYEEYGWQIWAGDEDSPDMGERCGEGDWFVTALIRFLFKGI